MLIPIGFGFYATLRFNHKIGDPPEGFSDITLKSADGTSLSAWYKSTQNGAAIILLHGSTASRERIRGYAEMLSRHGFGVLAYDMRGHGESGEDGVNAYGWNGTDDVRAAVKYLQHQKDVKSIGGLGISLGGEVLLGASASLRQLKAIVSDGASYRSLEDYLALPSTKRSIMKNFTTRLMFRSAEFFGRGIPPEVIVDSVSKARDTSFLLIAAGKIKKEIEYNNLFYHAAKNRSELWVAEGVGHIKAYSNYPNEYENKLIKFYDDNLLETKSSK